MLDDEARERLAPALAARKLVDFSGPRGWEHSATNLGRVESVGDSPDGIDAAQRRVLPLVEVRAPVLRRAHRARRRRPRGGGRGPRGARPTAHRIAVAENAAVFNGWGAVGIKGIAESSPHDPIALGEDCERYPRHVAKAVDALRGAAIDGPYGLALGPEAHTNVLETSQHGGYPLLEHLREIVGGPLTWAPGVEGAVVLRVGGGHFLFESGEDLSIGYLEHDVDAVRLYLEESFSFRVATPEAAVALTP